MNDEKNYTPGEEFANALSHAVGAMLSIFGIVMLAVRSQTATAAATTAVYGASMFLLFQASTCYHAMTNATAKRVFRRIDHSAIYLLIAGTYTPVLMIAVPFPTSVGLLAMIWYLAITGVVFSCLTLKFRYLSTGLYLVMGWLSLFLLHSLWQNGACRTIWLLLAGGAVYSVGIVFYLMKTRYMHSVWHLFVLGGAVCHYFAIYHLL